MEKEAVFLDALAMAQAAKSKRRHCDLSG